MTDTPQTDAPERIWAREKKTRRIFGNSTETLIERSWCEGYLNPDIANSCGATEYVRADALDASEAVIAALVEALRSAENRLEWLHMQLPDDCPAEGLKPPAPPYPEHKSTGRGSRSPKRKKTRAPLQERGLLLVWCGLFGNHAKNPLNRAKDVRPCRAYNAG